MFAGLYVHVRHAGVKFTPPETSLDFTRNLILGPTRKQTRTLDMLIYAYIRCM